MEELHEYLEDYVFSKEPNNIGDVASILERIDSRKYRDIPGTMHSNKAQYVWDLYKGNNTFVPELPKEKIPLKVLVANGDNNHAIITSFLNEIYDISIINTTDKDNPDLIIFTGGEDVSPQYYRENIGKLTHINEKRDQIESNIHHSYPYSIPRLGICRGAQFLAVMSGTTLIQHTTGHTQSHEITVPGFGTYMATSTHHQMIYPFNKTEDTYELLGFSKHFKSDTYLNGDNNEIDLDNKFLEVEIIKFGKSVLCIQGHPEFTNADRNYKDLCLNFIQKLVNKEEIEKKFNYTESITDRLKFNSSPTSRSFTSNGSLYRDPSRFTDFITEQPVSFSYTGGDIPVEDSIEETNTQSPI